MVDFTCKMCYDICIISMEVEMKRLIVILVTLLSGSSMTYLILITVTTILLAGCECSDIKDQLPEDTYNDACAAEIEFEVGEIVFPRIPSNPPIN